MISLLIASSLVALAVVVFLVFQVWSRYSRTGQTTGVVQLVPIDLDAFQNLIDVEEEQYLRENLPAAEFRKVQRLRISAAKAYVAALSQNAGTLAALGQSARFHADPEIAASGKRIFDEALRLKLWCGVSLIRLNGGLLFPVLLSPSNSGVNHYLNVKYMAASLGAKLAA